ncbi:MAG: porin [Gammaproteobacteria bacterium]
MKKHALGLAVTAITTALAAPAIALADGPTLYGKLNVSLDSIDTDTGATATSTNNFQLNSNASRIGIKGDTETGIQGLKGLYYAEFGVDVDDGTVPFTQRNIYAGLKGGFGTLRLGKIDTPLKDAQGKVDQFNDLAADIANLTAGETRANNSIYYSSPKIAGGLTLNLALYPGEGVDVDNADGDNNTATDVEEGIADSLSASVVWEKDALYAALAIDQNGSGSGNLAGFTDINGATTGTPSVADIVRAVVVYKADAFEVGALYQAAEDVGDATDAGEDTALVVSGAYKLDKWKFKAQYGTNTGDVSSAAADRERTITALGADYALGKSTTLFGYWAEVNNDPESAARPVTTIVSIGLDQKF